MEKAEKDNPGVIAPPPLIFLSGLILSGALAWLLPTQRIFPAGWFVAAAGIVLMIIGAALILTAILQMRRAETNVEPWKPTTRILNTGLYGISRNPIYLAMAFIYIGIALIVNSFWFLPPLVLVLAAIHYGVILREEKYLERKFGSEYSNYKTSVRRWL